MSSATHFNLYTLRNGKQLFAETIEAQFERRGTILFMHGLGSSTSFYYPALQSAQLSSYRLISFNMDGHGLSPVSSNSSMLTIEALANDVNGLLDVMGIVGAVDIVAHSMSGLVSCHFASLFPSRVNRLCEFSVSFNTVSFSFNSASNRLC